MFLFRTVLAALLLGLMPLASQAAALRVTILVAEEGGAYRDFAQSFAAEAGRQNLSLTMTQASHLSQEADLVVAVGAKSFALAVAGRTPVLAVLVTKAYFEKTLNDAANPVNKKTVTAIYLDQPSKRQLNLITAVLPEARKIALLFSAPSADVLNLRKAIGGSHFSLVEGQVASNEVLHRQLSSLLDGSDVLLAIPDAQIYNPNTMRNILLDAYQRNVPMIGISPSYVRAGALCAVFTSPEQFAAQAVSLTQKHLNEGGWPAAQYPAYFDVQLNQQVARSMNILLKDNAIVLKQMKAAEAEGVGK